MSYSPVAIVTGAARGIGLATTRRFLASGWRVAMVDRDQPELTRAAEGLEGVLTLPYDVSEPSQVDKMVAETLDAFDQVDALVNNAGVADFGPIEETDFARWRRVMETNLDGVYAAGDIVRGASLVVWAIRDGREAAEAMLARFDARGAAIAAE